jgi:hypothetical protein
VTSDYFNAYLYVTDKFGQALRQINRKTYEVLTVNIENST